MSDIQATIEEAFERRADITPRSVETHVKEATLEAIDMLDRGVARVAEKKDGDWVVNDWLKKAVLLSFRIEDNAFIKGGFTNYYDKVPSKYADTNSREFREGGVRVVPPATARKGSYIAPGAVLMPSYVNIGAYVDSGTMVDTWATVGSCAQIGKNVHLSGGVGIGGVLEPVQAAPTIIEDNCFIGARSEVVEGVIVEEGSVISDTLRQPVPFSAARRVNRDAAPPQPAVAALVASRHPVAENRQCRRRPKGRLLTPIRLGSSVGAARRSLHHQ